MSRLPSVLQSLPWSVDQTVLALVNRGLSKDDARILQSQDVDGDALPYLSDESLSRMGIPTFGRRIKVLRVAQSILDGEAQARGLIAPNLLNTAGGGAAAAAASTPSASAAAAAEAARDPYLPRGASSTDPFLRRGGNTTALGATAEFRPAFEDRYDESNLLDPAALVPAGSASGRFVGTRTRDFGVSSSSSSVALGSTLGRGGRADDILDNPRLYATVSPSNTTNSDFNRTALRHRDQYDVDRDREAEEMEADRGYDSDIERAFHHPRLDSQVAEFDPSSPPADPNDPFLHHDPSSKPKPWIGAIAQPSRVPPITNEPPAKRLQLEWVHGYRAFDSRSNLVYNAQGDIVYPVAGICVVYTPRLKRQRHFYGHDDDVRCLTQHPKDLNLIATGQSSGIKDGVSVPPHICVWDSSSADLSRSYTLKCTLADKGIRSVSFSGGEGKYLASISSDANYSLKIWDWSKRLLLTAAKSDTNPIYMVKGNPKDENEFVTVGRQHVLFWTFDGHVLKNRKGFFGGNNSYGSKQKDDGTCPINFYSITFSEKGYACCGAEDGSIYVFVGGKVAKVFSGVHRGKILSLEWYNGGFVSGGSDGKVHVLDKKMDVAKSFQFSNKVTSVAIGGPHGNDSLLVGTQGADVFEIPDFFDQTIEGDEKLEAVTRGHSDGELWALAVAGDGKHYVTAGEDNTLCLWSVETHRLLKRGIISSRTGHVTKNIRRAGTTSTHPVNQCARAVAISPNGTEILVGSNEGELVIFDTRTFAKKTAVNLAQYKKELRSAVDGFSGKRSIGNSAHNQWISTIQFSPSGHAVAVGTHGCVVVLLDVTAGYRVKAVIDRSNAPITAIDWSADASLLQVNDSNFELLHYHVDEQDLKHITPITNSSSVRDVQWYSHTCALSWPTSGVTQPHHQGQFVNTVDAAPSRTLLATGDDSGHVNLFRFPALPGSQPLVYSGHSAHVTSARFTADERFLLTTGGHDLSIFAWRVL